MRLKDPAPSTLKEWERHLLSFHALVKENDPTRITKADAQKYRDYLLDSVAASTAKTRLHFACGLFALASQEGWISENPFAGITKRIKVKTKAKEVVDLGPVDRQIDKLPQHERWVYMIMRFTGTHISEAGGIRANDLRPLKTGFRSREIPIVEKLRPPDLGRDAGHPEDHHGPRVPRSLQLQRQAMGCSAGMAGTYRV